ncbi:MAG: VWA domain-containing protein [Gammaproteobacteria bacterium]
MLQLAWIYLLAALPLPLLALWLSPRAPRYPETALRVPFFQAFSAQPEPGQSNRPRLLVATLVWVLLVLAASRPQWIGEPLSLPLSGRDLMLAVDISGSMRAEDMVTGGNSVTRLQAVQAIAGEFIERRQGDRIGLILFGSQAYLQAPLTFDRATVRTLLNEAEIGLAGKETAIGDAIGLAVKRMRDQPATDRVLILLTDGANNAGEIDPLRATDLAVHANLKIYTIGVGAETQASPDPFRLGNLGLGDLTHFNPPAQIDEKTLKAIADASSGRYFRARDAASLEDIYRLLDQLEPSAVVDQTYRPVRELYPWPLAAALALSAALALAALRPRLRRGHWEAASHAG